MNIQRRLHRWARVVTLLLLASWVVPTLAVVPNTLTYQGYLTDAAGAPIDGVVNISFGIFTVATGGTPQWADTQLVTVARGLFHVELGNPANPFPMGLFETPLFLGIAVGGDPEMTPRQPITTVGFAFKADDADSLQGQSAESLDQSAHVADTNNPHAVTAAQIGAVPDSAPLELSDGTPFGSAIHGTHTGNGNGVRGDTSSASAGVYGANTGSGSGVYGTTSGGGNAVYGWNSATGNIGFLGGSQIGAYGGGVYSGVYGVSTNGYGVYGVSSNGIAGYFEGNTNVTGALDVGGNATISGALNGGALDVGSNASISGALKVGIDPRDYQLFEAVATSTDGWANFIDYNGFAIGSLTGANRQMVMFTDGAGDQNIFTVATSETSGASWGAQLVIQQNGKVGIGTDHPDANLQILGADNDGTTAALKLTSSGQNLLLDGNEIDVVGGDGKLFLNNNTNGDIEVGGHIKFAEETGYYSVSHYEFRPDPGIPGVTTDDVVYEHRLVRMPNGGQLQAPVHLPHGVYVTALALEYSDTYPGETYFGSGTLFRSAPKGSTEYWETTMASVDTVYGGAIDEDTAIESPHIDNKNYKYYLTWTVDSPEADGGFPNGKYIALWRVRIEYTYTTP
jgi:hypothetical protein